MGNFLRSDLEPDTVFVRNDNLLIIVDLELRVNRLALQFLDLVLVQLAAFDVSEGPGDQVVACGADDRAFLACRSEIIESGGQEVNVRNLVLRKVFGQKLKLLGVGLLFAHTVVKAGLSVVAQGRDDQQVGLGGGQDPVAVAGDLERSDGVL